MKKSFLEKLTGIDSEKTAEKTSETEISEEEKEKNLEPKKEKNEWVETEGQLTIDMYQMNNEIVIKSTIAGVKPEDIDVTLANDIITIRGKRIKEEEVKPEDYFYQELYWGAFSRSIILPTDVEAEKIEASMKDGILTVKIPKAEKVKTKKIKVKTE